MKLAQMLEKLDQQTGRTQPSSRVWVLGRVRIAIYPQNRASWFRVWKPQKRYIAFGTRHWGVFISWTKGARA